MFILLFWSVWYSYGIGDQTKLVVGLTVDYLYYILYTHVSNTYHYNITKTSLILALSDNNPTQAYIIKRG